MLDKINAVLDQIEEDRQRQLDLEPEANSLTFLQKVYRNSVLPLSTRMRAAMAALPHEVPKLGVSVNINDDGTFAQRLDAALERRGLFNVIARAAEPSWPLPSQSTPLGGFQRTPAQARRYPCTRASSPGVEALP